MDGAVIKVIGLGGAGNNAVNRMIESGLSGVEFIAANTDAQVLAKSLADIRVQLGDKLTRGLGAGANPEIGEKAALEAQDLIAEHLDGADLVFITAGMGGGTGTGSAPIVAEVAKSLGALTVGVVTRPFAFEGPKRSRTADEGIKKLRERVDAMVAVSNDRLLTAIDKKVALKDAFLIADRVLYHGVKGITDVINLPGLINVDFADVRTLLEDAGPVLMGIGAGRGENKVEEAARTATQSPLLDRSIEGARRLLLNVVGSEDLSLMEAAAVVEYIREATGNEDVDILYGVTYDERAQDELRVILIATGFGDSSVIAKPAGARLVDFPTSGVDITNFEIPAFIRYGDGDYPPKRGN
ncbi:MAG: cell division protein FtsZ [Deinococcota bacterium]|uniref:Cell division protein FtsZ n=1 Tax=Allomeiothermus silvanus (strain ATCC 700542 / DSM 9946 / NBRC 106475 / NCIMB 13440 / VI-R2) TaxID=526227 RepID=D7BFJ9_ALLS1|nr:cell division protein FtsZ [Allomeiothermus silvanus]ADH63552.1 cell division protein FtsZ [Allomeiothermus silvanus DSM 9946]MBI5812182.1 cell division protein FtsZ [Allomeiothermus silvanus]